MGTAPREHAQSVTTAIWLPVGRANFYSVSADSELHGGTCQAPYRCRAKFDSCKRAFQCSTMRRLLEVLPTSFGYDEEATYTTNHTADLERPIKLTMTLAPEADATAPPTQGAANGDLISAGVTRVTFTADEDGFYVWTAEGHSEANEASAMEALRTHAKKVLGGDFALRRAKPEYTSDAKLIDGEMAVAMYNAKDPLGALTFFQLNTLVEGLLNETLYPAVFFENQSLVTDWMRAQERRNRPSFHSIEQFVELIDVTVARHLPSHGAILTRFLAATSREILQRLKWSIESVRRNLLDEMLGILHRRSPLTQLSLAQVDNTPDQANGGSESQLRGYVMLAAAKMPLFNNVARHAQAAATSLTRLNGSAELDRTVSEWGGLIEAVDENIRGLERAIEHAWMERLLYEQEQSRAEQEAVAEIERSRNSRTPLVSTDTLVNAVVLLFTVITLAWTVHNSTKPERERNGLGTVLGPAVVGGLVIILVLVSFGIYRWVRTIRGGGRAFDVELALRLDQPVDPDKVQDYLNAKEPAGNGRFKVQPRSGVRIERISQDSTLVKLHSLLTRRERWARTLHFEVVNEILIHTAVNEQRTVLRETRVFGDTRRPLKTPEVIEVAQAALLCTVGRMTAKPTDLDVDKVLKLPSSLLVLASAPSQPAASPTPAPAPTSATSATG
jgi:hypothetical protein